MQRSKVVFCELSAHESSRADGMARAESRGSRMYAWHPIAAPVPVRVVREDIARYSAYESEGSERRALASIPVAPDAQWTATLTVPIGGGDVAFLQVERQGELPAGYRGAEESALLSLPIGEVDALIELLGGVVAQARRDGVLPVE